MWHKLPFCHSFNRYLKDYESVPDTVLGYSNTQGTYKIFSSRKANLDRERGKYINIHHYIGLRTNKKKKQEAEPGWRHE